MQSIVTHQSVENRTREAGRKYNQNPTHYRVCARASLSDTHGIRTGEDDDSLASSLTKPQIEQLIDKGVISAGMLPKVEACFTALAAGVNKTHIVDGRIPHSLLLEIFSRQGIGTQIVLN